MNRNYSKELERIIQRQGSAFPRLLLHACCGPCSTSVLEYLSRYFDISVLWYNPNIYPEEEFEKRFRTLIEVIQKMGLSDRVQVLAEPWNNSQYEMRVKGLENEPEGGKRCEQCFRLRLLEAGRIAKKYNFDCFCSTLTVSRHKNAELINSIGEEVSKAVGVPWLPSDFKKKDGENRSVELSESLGIYRQLYCGCRYSLSAREAGASDNKCEDI
ncbi:MAG: epoxyqueuosine reductase QueH [Oscillospiraceae bacterium]|nr:epoxyqueuosine reductase QueH [Oscillospiraceae bacterium]